jgi:acetoacetate decarboxylase
MASDADWIIFEHAVTHLADLRILEFVSTKRLLCDMTLDVGELAFAC